MLFAQAFVLSYKNVGERDRRYSLLTEEFGKVQAIVRSILKPNSKLAGHLEPPSFSWVELIETAKGLQLTQTLEQNSFPGLRKNPGAISLVLRLTKFLDDFLTASDAVLSFDSNSKVFSIWENFLVEIEKKVTENRDLDWQLLEAELIIGVLKELGLLPDIFHCSDCGKDLEPAGGVFFGGRCFCPDCVSAVGGSAPGGKNQNISASPSADGLDKDFYSECQKILAGEILFAPQAGPTIKKTAFYFKRQAQGYML